jgi:hypothetical protein
MGTMFSKGGQYHPEPCTSPWLRRQSLKKEGTVPLFPYRSALHCHAVVIVTSPLGGVLWCCTKLLVDQVLQKCDGEKPARTNPWIRDIALIIYSRKCKTGSDYVKYLSIDVGDFPFIWKQWACAMTTRVT